MAADTCPAATKRVRFRPYRPDDVDAVAAMFDDPAARRWYPDHHRPDRARAWIDWNLEHYATHGLGLWVLEDRRTQAFLGDCGLTYQDVEGEQLLEVGYHLDRRHRGRGYATEAAQACLTHGLDEVGAGLVCSIVAPDNAGSIRVARRIHAEHRTFATASGRTMNLYWTMAPPPDHAEST